MRRQAQIACTLAVASILFSLLAFMPKTASAYTPHDPIFISGNENFTASNGVVAGNGTWSSPFIIEGWAINSSTARGIEIMNTNAHFTIRDCWISGDWSNYAMNLRNVSNGRIQNVTAENGFRGFQLQYSSNNTIAGNVISWNRDFGILLISSSNTTVAGNMMVEDGIHISGELLEHWNSHTIDASNTVNGKPVYYWKDAVGGTVAGDAGQVILANCTDVIVENQNVSDGSVGIELGFSSGNTIANNTASNGWFGIYLQHSSNNTIANSTALNNDVGILIVYSSNDNVLANTTASSNSEIGIWLHSSSNNTLSNNTASSNGNVGIFLHYSSNSNILIDNTASYNTQAVSLLFNRDNTIKDNVMVRNGIYILGEWVWHWNSHTIDASNTVNGKPVYYWKDAVGGTVAGDAGQVILANCTDVIVENQNVSDGSVGIELGFSSGNTIANNTVLANNLWGILLWYSSNNVIASNTVSENSRGISLRSSSSNWIYHNNFMNNTNQAFDDGDTSIWQEGYPSGGNYWSDYGGVDEKSGPGQDQPGSDGIGDQPYEIDTDSRDLYPLMLPVGTALPRPPSSPQATLSGRNLENVTITWTLSMDDGDGLRSVVGYEILRGTVYDPKGLGYGLTGSVPNGTCVYVDSLEGEGNPDTYFYRVCAIDAFNTTCAVAQASKFTHPLTPGPNLVSVPLIQSNESIETVLQTVQYDKAWYYDSSSQEWKWFMKYKEYRRGLWNMNHTMGLWVNVTEDSNLTAAGVVPVQTTIHLYEGWNLVSFPSFNSSYTVYDVKMMGAMRMEGYDPLPPHHLRVLADAEVLQAGYGYWVKVQADADWIVEVS